MKFLYCLSTIDLRSIPYTKVVWSSLDEGLIHLRIFIFFHLIYISYSGEFDLRLFATESLDENTYFKR